ncbi:glutamate ABC transporter substrate-binding protein [Actinomadura barringtoniae]|uniref:Glutamate ABC transporter substrate-binding protein n=1 Tax=Actinomadura barringtoniae TaxID=1427535 RepID=A0A939PJU0_9ACTN|nr:glutamate ABC transporter substrate-binding protein [Actinomadura barringtoniae]
MGLPRTAAAAALPALALTASALAGCTASSSASIADQKTITVGVKADQPGLSLKGTGGTYRGFEVDAGTYIARKMGATKVEYATVTSENRESLLNKHKVDIVLASYSITAERAKLVTFGGPYYLAHQDIMVRVGENRIHQAHDLAGRRMCQASGSVSTSRVVSGLGIPAVTVPSPSYSACYQMLLDGRVDAVSTGDMVLAGFAAEGRSKVKVVGAPFSDERYGVGLRKGDIDGCEGVNKAITEMYQDGTASRLLRKWFGASGVHLVESVPEFEGCG